MLSVPPPPPQNGVCVTVQYAISAYVYDKGNLYVICVNNSTRISGRNCKSARWWTALCDARLLVWFVTLSAADLSSYQCYFNSVGAILGLVH
jgi:hypothetical protein